MTDTVGSKAARLAHFIHKLHGLQIISRSRALNALDRLATRLDNEGETRASEYVSKIYMMCH